MEIGLKLPETTEMSAVEFAVRAEERKFDAVWTGELWGEDAFVKLTRIAERTENVRLGTAVVNVFSRSPALLAMGARSVAQASNGRFALGIGSSTAKAVEDLHGLSFHRPVRRIHETVQLIHEFLDGSNEPVNYEGQLFSVADFSPLEADIPVLNAALGPANRRVTGRVCDGWIPYNIPFSNIEPSFETIVKSAQEVGRDPDDIEVVLGVNAIVSDDPDEARHTIRGVIGYYAANGEGYRRMISQLFPEETESIVAAWQAGNRDKARRHVTKEMVDEFGVAGNPEEVRERLRTILDKPIIDGIYLDIPKPIDDSLVEYTVEELSPERL